MEPPLPHLVPNWNCRGIANSSTLRALHHLIFSNSPDIVFLLEPLTLSPPSSLLSSLGFDGFFSNNNHSTAFIWCLFKTNSTFKFSLSKFFTQYLTITFTNPVNGNYYLLTGIYASTNYVRRELWEYLTSQASSNPPWCVLGDFNSIISASEKLSLRLSRLNTDFQQMMLASGLQDMGFSRNIFTCFSNCRGTSYVAARLDRALRNHQWISISSDPLLSHLPKISSDHCPLLLSHNQRSSPANVPFKFEAL